MKKGIAQFTWKGISNEEFAVFNQFYRAGENGDIKVHLNYQYDLPNRIIYCNVTADFINRSNIYLRCGLVCGFEISEASWEERTSESGMHIDLEKELLVHFGVFTVGTLRGYLHARQQRSQVAAFLPPVNVLAMVKNLEEVSLETGKTNKDAG